MKRKLLTLKGLDGRVVRVKLRREIIGDVTSEMIIDPEGVLTDSSPPGHGLSSEEKKVFSRWKQQLLSGKTKVKDYP